MPTPSSAGPVPVAAVVSSAASATARDAVEPAVAAERRGQHDVGFHLVAGRAEARRHSSTARSACATAAAPSPVAIASSADTHANRTASRRRPRPSSKPRRAASAAAEAANRPDAERVGGQTDQRVGARLGIAAGHRQRAAVPAARLVVPTELTQERRLGAVGQRRQPADTVRAPDASEVGVGVWRSGPARRRRLRGATTPRRSRAAGSGQRPGSSPKAALAIISRRRYQ